ncbi:MAG: hypothetical protein OHK0013_29010 [Sandaracinaceae bacterium]
MKRALRILIVLALGVTGGATPGCVEESPELTATEREALREYISSQAPRPQHELDIRFENKVRLIGYDVDVETVTPGQPFQITWYWRVERRLGGGWLQFTHLADGSGADRINQDMNGVVRERYPASRWRANEYIRDVQTITLPADWGSDRVVFYLGFWHDEHRLQVSSGPNDGENRARAASIPVAASRPEEPTPTTIAPGAAAERPTAPPPELDAHRVSGAITIDGRLDEADWRETAPSGAFVNTMNGSAAQPNASVKVMWNDEALFVGFDVGDDFLRNTLRGRDAHLWEQDCVEIMVDPDGDGRDYFELQVSPTGEVFDTHYASRRQPQPFGNVAWNAQIETRVATRGTANDDADDQGYSVEIRLPWASFQHGESPAMGTPPADSVWRLNFYVMDTRREGGQRAVGWSPPLEGDFHVPARFGRVRFSAPQVAADGAAIPRALPVVLPAGMRIRPEDLARAPIRPPPATAVGAPRAQ